MNVKINEEHIKENTLVHYSMINLNYRVNYTEFDALSPCWYDLT